jgi:hypothetical protein
LTIVAAIVAGYLIWQSQQTDTSALSRGPALAQVDAPTAAHCGLRHGHGVRSG